MLAWLVVLCNPEREDDLDGGRGNLDGSPVGVNGCWNDIGGSNNVCKVDYLNVVTNVKYTRYARLCRKVVY
jgi:hypothetical protein